MHALRLVEVTSLSALTPLKEEWNLLVKRAETSTIFQTFEWHESWIKSIGAQGAIRILLVYEEEALIGIAPFFIRPKTINCLPELELSFIGTSNYASDYADFIVQKGSLNVLAHFFLWLDTNRAPWSIIDFSNLPTHSAHVPVIHRELRRMKSKVLSRVQHETPTIILGDKEKDLKLTQKKSLKRHYNWFTKNGALEFKHCDEADEIKTHLDTFFAQHIQRRALAGGESLFLKKEEQVFYRTLTEALLPTGWLKFSVVTFNAKPVAYHFGFEFEKKFIWYKPSFDTELESKSPGEVLIKSLLEYSIAHHLEEFDFTVGSEAFKYRFANLVRTNHQIKVFKRWPSFCAAKLRSALRRSQKKMLPTLD